MFGLQEIDFFYIFRKYNILKVYCKNFTEIWNVYEATAHSRERAEIN